MSNFEKAHKFVAKWEGGFVDHPNDPGGATKYGISLRFLKSLDIEFADIDGDGDIDVDDIKNLTTQEAAKIYKMFFWDSQKIGEMPLTIAVAHYDAAVNTGIKQSNLFLQRTLNQYSSTTGIHLTVDGIMGKNTLKAISNLNTKQALLIAKGLIARRADFYEALVDRKPKYKPFKDGWLNRLVDLQRYISKL